jgi:hypothetical protein
VTPFVLAALAFAASVDAGAGVVAGEPAIGLDPLVGLQAGKGAVDLWLGAPLRFSFDGRPRARDWDERDEVLRVLRRAVVHVGPALLWGGELAGVTLGNGALVRGYLGNPDPDHHAAGVLARLRTDALDLDLLADDLPRTDVVAARALLRPAALTALAPGSARLGVGLTLAADLGAPGRAPGWGGAGAGLGTWRPAVGSKDLDALAAPPDAARVPSLGALSLDAEYLLFARAAWRLAPFAVAGALAAARTPDGAGASGGAGLHGGAHLWISPAAGVTIDVRAAAVLAGPGYLPGVLGPLYRLERYGFPLPARGAVAAGAPTLGAALGALPSRGMAVVDAAVTAGDLAVAAGWTSPAGGGAGHRWYARASIERLGPFTAAISAAGDGPALLLGAAEATLHFGWFYVRASGERAWVARDGGRYAPTWSGWLALGVAAAAETGPRR